MRAHSTSRNRVPACNSPPFSGAFPPAGGPASRACRLSAKLAVRRVREVPHNCATTELGQRSGKREADCDVDASGGVLVLVQQPVLNAPSHPGCRAGVPCAPFDHPTKLRVVPCPLPHAGKLRTDRTEPDSNLTFEAVFPAPAR